MQMTIILTVPVCSSSEHNRPEFQVLRHSISPLAKIRITAREKNEVLQLIGEVRKLKPWDHLPCDAKLNGGKWRMGPRAVNPGYHTLSCFLQSHTSERTLLEVLGTSRPRFRELWGSVLKETGKAGAWMEKQHKILYRKPLQEVRKNRWSDCSKRRNVQIK